MLDALHLLTVACLFAAAWLISRSAAYIARKVLSWHDRHTEAAAATIDVRIANVKRRETTVAVASFVIILAGFAIQRVLMDVIAGTMMFVERWYAVGDTIAIPTLELQGIVEDVPLRRTKLRTLDGETIQVSNSQIPAVRVLPEGLKELAIELFVTDRESGENLVRAAQRILPEGPTTFARRPWIEKVNELDDRLVRIRLRASVVAGREWLVEGFLSDLLKERADEDLIVHGPVMLTVDEQAARSFARASAATRWAGRPAPQQG